MMAQTYAGARGPKRSVGRRGNHGIRCGERKKIQVKETATLASIMCRTNEREEGVIIKGNASHNRQHRHLSFKS